jgi:subtilisin family serine protease
VKRTIVSVALAALALAACGKGAGSSATSDADRLAQSQLRNADAAARTCWTDASTFTGCEGSTLSEIEPSLNFVDGDTPGVNAVSMSVDDGGGSWSAATWSASGTCFTIVDNGSDASIESFASQGQSCTADRA